MSVVLWVCSKLLIVCRVIKLTVGFFNIRGKKNSVKIKFNDKINQIILQMSTMGDGGDSLKLKALLHSAILSSWGIFVHS